MKQLNKNILKITGMFGSQQMVSIVCSVIRSKLIAMWIGPAGVGLTGIFTSAITTIGSLSQLNLRQTAVRQMAAAPQGEINRVAHAVRRIACWLGLAGALLMLALSPWLSEFSFGEKGGWASFAWLSVTILLLAINNGEAAIFQGFRQYRRLTICLTAGSIGGLAVSVPMYYFWRLDSIVPSLIAFYAVTWLALGFIRYKLPAITPKLSVRQTLGIGRQFLQLGVYLTISDTAVNAINYIFLAWLTRYADIDTAGVYNAGFTLINRYAGLIFAAIAMEYFPRLASVQNHPRRESAYVSNQILVALSILVPIATIFAIVVSPVIRLLYSHAFIGAVPMVALALVGTCFRCVSWCMAYVIVARADGRTFLFTEIASAVIAVALNIVGYRMGGFIGLGVAYSVWYILYTLIICAIYYRKYHLSINVKAWQMLIYAVTVATAVAICAVWFSAWWGIPIALLSIMVAIWQVRTR